ncbi:MAG: SDR family oxidoreductase [Chromatiales bacterium]|jgi:NAD(P)-dependent dehydrogenase (short-subunit alcohol dehydrogenase family)|nr:SDR family oxidoreductase [Chromatiales bacterium]
MTSRSVLVTGANRGIGLEHARRYLARGWRVFAGVRDPSRAAALAALPAAAGQLMIVPLDVTSGASVQSAVAAMGGTSLDVVVNNAGTYGPVGWSEQARTTQAAGGMDYDVWRQILEVNLLGAFRVAEAFRTRLEGGERPLHVLMSSDLGSIANNRMGQSHAYRSSKAALNMVCKGLAIEWPGIISVALAPGWCRTDLGGADAPIDPADSVAAQQETFDRLTLADSGRFIDRFGETVPW